MHATKINYSICFALKIISSFSKPFTDSNMCVQAYISIIHALTIFFSPKDGLCRNFVIIYFIILCILFT